jgi:hypothetical protein
MHWLIAMLCYLPRRKTARSRPPGHSEEKASILHLHMKKMHIILQQIPQSPLFPSRLSFASCPIQSGRRQELLLLELSSETGTAAQLHAPIGFPL